MDSFAGNFPLLIVALFECISLSYIYGIKRYILSDKPYIFNKSFNFKCFYFRFADDIELMTGSRPGLYWMICWKYVSPIAMIIILTASLIELATNGSSYPAWNALKGITEPLEWPHWCIVLAVFLIFVSVLWIPIVACLRYTMDLFTSRTINNNGFISFIDYLVSK